MSNAPRKIHLFQGILPKLIKFILNPASLKDLLRWVIPLWFRGGFPALIQARKEQILTKEAKTIYKHWSETVDRLTDADRLAIRRRIERLPFQPLISIVMPVYNVEEEWLRKAIESVRKQLYTHWELCIADDHSPAPHIRKVLEEYQALVDPLNPKLGSKIKICFREVNGHISEASNSALEMTRGEFTALLDHDDELSEHALYWIIEELNQHPEADLIYSDEDKIDAQGLRYDPHFKSDWNPDLFYSMNLVTHLAVFRTSILKAIGGFRKGYEGSQDYDLTCRVVSQSQHSKIRHIPAILYHWRAIPGSTALRSQEKNYAVIAARRAISDHLTQLGIFTQVTKGHGPLHRVHYSLPPRLPQISLIIRSKPNSPNETAHKIRKRLKKNLQIAEYPPEYIEVLFAQTENSQAVARGAKGEILIFINSSLVALSKGWLKELVSQGLRPEIGIVAPKILAPDGTIEKAGIVLGTRGVEGIMHYGCYRYLPSNLGRVYCIQSTSAVSGDAIAIRKNLFQRVGGFEESRFPNYADIDLCLRVRKEGLRVLWTPFSELMNMNPSTHSSLTEKTRNSQELASFQAKWKTEFSQEDPYYNPNLSLTPVNYLPTEPSRVRKPWIKVGGPSSGLKLSHFSNRIESD